MGTRAAIIMPNGAGKSTLQKLLSGWHLISLSGWQKVRVVLASMALRNCTMLLLELYEPMNYLDMQTNDTLAKALCEFTRWVVLVSHHSRLISRLCEDEEGSEVRVAQAAWPADENDD